MVNVLPGLDSCVWLRISAGRFVSCVDAVILSAVLDACHTNDQSAAQAASHLNPLDAHVEQTQLNMKIFFFSMVDLMFFSCSVGRDSSACY